MTQQYESFEAMVAAQRQELRAAKIAARAAWLANMEATVADAVPIRPRIVSLLNEARSHERARTEAFYRSARLGAVLDPIRQSHLAHIDKGYLNLLRDVTNRCGGIVKTNAPASAMWAIGSEAIGCFSTMLPWSDGVANRDAAAAPPAEPLPISPIAAVGTSGAFRSGRPPQMASRVVGGIMGMPTIRIQHRDPSSTTVVTQAAPAATPRWTVPTRLNVDNRKLAATVASRRSELQRMKKAPTCGAQLQSMCGATDRARGSVSVTVA